MCCYRGSSLHSNYLSCSHSICVQYIILTHSHTTLTAYVCSSEFTPNSINPFAGSFDGFVTNCDVERLPPMAHCISADILLDASHWWNTLSRNDAKRRSSIVQINALTFMGLSNYRKIYRRTIMSQAEKNEQNEPYKCQSIWIMWYGWNFGWHFCRSLRKDCFVSFIFRLFFICAFLESQSKILSPSHYTFRFCFADEFHSPSP